MNLEALGKRAAAISALIVAATLVLGLVGRLSWEMWLKAQVRDVVRSEVSDVRMGLAELAGALGAPDSVQIRIRLRNEFGPSPR